MALCRQWWTARNFTSGVILTLQKDRKTAFEWQINQVKRGFKLNGFNALQNYYYFFGNQTPRVTYFGVEVPIKTSIYSFCNDAIVFFFQEDIIFKNYLLFFAN